MTTCATCCSASRSQDCPTCGSAAACTTTATARPQTSSVPQAGGQPAAAAPAYGKAQFVGDAAPTAGIPISRVLNALCCVVTGIALFLVAGQGVSSAWVAVLLGLAAVGYGLKIVLTRSSYWVASIVYVAPIAAIAWAISAISH